LSERSPAGVRPDAAGTRPDPAGPRPARPHRGGYQAGRADLDHRPGRGGPLVTVSVASKDTGGLLVCWAARVSRVEPGSAEWSGIIGALLAGRLNEPENPGAPSPAE